MSTVLRDIRLAGVAFDLRQQFLDAPDLFHGASVTVTGNTSLSDLAAVSGVRNVWAMRKTFPPKPYAAPASGQGPGSDTLIKRDFDVGAHSLLYDDELVPGGLAKRATAAVAASKYKVDTFSPHAMTGVDVLHKRGILGKGVKVAIIDTGVDYKNPILGGCFGKGCHISFGYDLVGDAYDGSSTPEPGPDPYASCQAHGTHVTGILGALPNKYGFTGVAPEATLGMYRIFGCDPYGFVADDVIVAAITRAYKDGAQVVSMSIGEPAGFLASSAPQALVDKLSAKGVVFATAAGNEGYEGLFFGESPGVTTRGMAVASVDVRELPAFQAQLTGHGSLTYQGTVYGPLVSNKTLEVYFTSTNPKNTSDACAPLPKGLDLSNKLVVVQRGDCLFVDKMTYVAARKGAYMLIYNSPTGAQLPLLDHTATGLIGGVGGLSHQQGLDLLALYKKNKTLKVKLTSTALVRGVADTTSGGLVSEFSNFGPSGDLIGQPSLAAPGGNIFSTLPRNVGGVGVLSGTSMATPFVSGAAALLLSARKTDKLSPEEVRALLSSSGKLLREKVNSKGALSTVLLQGGGLIQVDAAVAATTIVTPSEISLNDTAFGVYAQMVTIRNLNKYAVKYTFGEALAKTLGLYVNGTSDILPNTTPAEVKGAIATVKWAKSSLTVAAGKTATIKVTFTPPSLSAAEASKFPLFSGWLKLVGTAKGTSQTFAVPYFGLAAKISDAPVLDTTDTVYGPGQAYPFLLNAKKNAVQVADAGVYTFASGPQFGHRLAMACRRLTWDLVDAGVDYQGTVATANNGGTAGGGARMGKRGHVFGPGSGMGLHARSGVNMLGGGAVVKRLAVEPIVKSEVANVTIKSA